MKNTEKILGIIFVLGLILKIANISGGMMLVLISSLLLSTLYFYLGFALFNDIPLNKVFKNDTYLSISKNKIIYAISVGFGLSILLTAIFFKLQNYTGQIPMMLVGLSVSLINLIFGIVKFAQNKSSFYKKILIRLIIFGSLWLSITLYF